MRKKFFLLAFVLAILTVLPSCGGVVSTTSASKRTYIAVVSKGFQHQFWQAVFAGSKAAAAEFDVDITFEGPPSEADIDKQIEMVNAALSKQPAALCLAALDVSSLMGGLEAAKAAGVPVIGFDSGVPDAPEGIIFSTASTNNYAAGEMAAAKMMEEPSIAKRIAGASPDSPVCIGVLSQDAVSASILDRTNGFVNALKAIAENAHPGAVAVIGYHAFAQPAAGKAAVEIKVLVPSTSEYTNAQISAQKMLQDTGALIGVFCSNEGAVTGLLAATNEGMDLDREKGVYKDITVVGFDAGITQKNAVKKQYFYGSITQDPYRIGYLAVELAYRVVNGEAVDAVVDTGCKFYNYDNIDEPDIAQLVYD